ncbi:hypothetical protein GOP47_0027112 [Adiantum capillus-veneris]|nr:hypothetical protein GOP47_0027112 [Adiantum capillus-veneris]
MVRPSAKRRWHLPGIPMPRFVPTLSQLPWGRVENGHRLALTEGRPFNYKVFFPLSEASKNRLQQKCSGESVSGDDGAALLKLLKSLKPRGAGCVATTWVSQSGDACPSSFCGVSCVGDAVVALDLSGQGLQGSIPPNSITMLHSLTSLNLSNNFLSGELPNDLGNLSNLEALDLSHNQFTGSIPISISALQSLLHLNVSSNRLRGSLPSEFSSLTTLRSLDLHDNQLSGVLDAALLGLSSLTTIDLSSNKLSGFVPWQPNDTLPLLQIVEHVNLSHNQLSGPLAPAKLASVFAEKLKVLDMSHNQLFGNLPDFEFVIALVSLRLNNNFFTGAVPPTLLSAGLGLLEELDLSHNNLTGEVPRILSTSLKIVNISFNSLSGTLPEKLGSCSIVDLNHNNIIGDLSVWQYWSDVLEVLDISFNRLTGMLRDDVLRFMRLRILNISHNGLSGSIPFIYGLLPKLSAIDLSFNKLTGAIPASFFNSSTLSTLVLSNNLLMGSRSLPEDAPSSAYASQIVVLDLSHNRLSGTISEKIKKFQRLRRLDLGHNVLSGLIPIGICNLSMLQVLDLSSNLLMGPIPAALPNTLLLLQLANNNLSGQIPQNLQKFTNTSFFPGNDGLFAVWPLSTGQASPTTGLSPQHTSFSAALKAGIIGGCLAGLALLAVVGLLMYYKRVTRPKSYSNTTQKEFDTTGKTKDNAGGHKLWNPCAACFAFTEHPLTNPPSGLSFSDNLLLEKEPKHRGVTWGTVLDVENPSKSRVVEEFASASRQQKSSPTRNEPRTSEELLASPAALKVQSPDKLAGDLHFLDKSLRFTAEELSRAPAEVLGRSSHGTSYKATLDNGHVLTVKWLREGLAKSKKEFAREAKKFAKLRHPNLIPLRGYYWGPREHEKLILSDFVSNRSLAGHLNDRTAQGNAPLSWRQRLVIAVDIARGLAYLHDERHLSHGNLKATNVMIDGGSFCARLADYGLHQLMTSEGTANQILNAGALGYRAPELATMQKPKPSFKGDIYAFGVLMLELLTGQGAGDIISGQSGAVDLTDWVRMLAREVRALDCFDPALASVGGTQGPPPGVEEVLALALKCISQQPNERPDICIAYEELAAINV